MIWFFVWWVIGISVVSIAFYIEIQQGNDIGMKHLLISPFLGLLWPIIGYIYLKDAGFFDIVVVKGKQHDVGNTEGIGNSEDIGEKGGNG